MENKDLFWIYVRRLVGYTPDNFNIALEDGGVVYHSIPPISSDKWQFIFAKFYELQLDYFQYSNGKVW